jgi:hypothetical protein
VLELLLYVWSVFQNLGHYLARGSIPVPILVRPSSVQARNLARVTEHFILSSIPRNLAVFGDEVMKRAQMSYTCASASTVVPSSHRKASQYLEGRVPHP